MNLDWVLTDLHLQHTVARSYFEEAVSVIARETEWKKQHSFDYTSSHTQIYPGKHRSAKLFGHAAAIIVAMEVAARKLKPDLNVYDRLRILAAAFFVDRFDDARFTALTAYHDGMTAEARTAVFGPGFEHKDFAETCCEIIGQSRHGVLQQLANGFCVTRFIAERVMAFVNDRYPTEFAVGPVRVFGEDLRSPGLGRKSNAAPELLAPRSIPEADLPPCR